MKIYDEIDLKEKMQVDGSRKVVYILHSNCNVENFGDEMMIEETQVMNN